MDEKQIYKMLSALLINSGQLHWVGGYAHHLTAKGDRFIVLYPPGDKLDIKVCRVYAQHFDKLPPFIDIDNDMGMYEETVPIRPSKMTMTKTEARDAGIYCECPSFQILTVNGKDTNFGPEKRFYDTLWYPDKTAVSPRSPKPTPKSVDTSGLGRWEFLSGGDCPSSCVPLFKQYEDQEGKRPFSLDNLKEWYQKNK